MTVMVIPEAIERVALLGWHVYPASRVSRAACFEGASNQATSDLDVIAGWCDAYPNCNWRVVFEPSMLWGLDLDVPPDHEDGVGAFKAIVAENSPLPVRPTMQTGSGGVGLFFAWNGEPIIGKSGHPAPGIDPRRGKLSQTIPPSVHIKNGKPYRWIIPPWEVSPPKAPQWLLTLMAPPPIVSRPAPVLNGDTHKRRYAIGALRHAIERVATAPSGQANDTLNRQTWSMTRFIAEGSLTESEVRDSLLASARVRAIPIREAVGTINSGLKAKRA